MCERTSQSGQEKEETWREDSKEEIRGKGREISDQVL